MKHPPYANPAPLIDHIFDMFLFKEAAKAEIKEAFALRADDEDHRDWPDVEDEREDPRDFPEIYENA